MKSKKMTAGFTLVELIVVIAILGILACVGTVGYSGYIKKANAAADQQLLSHLNTAFAAACAANGESHYGRSDTTIALAGDEGAKEATVSVSGITDFSASFGSFFEGGTFKTIKALMYSSKIGGFVETTAQMASLADKIRAEFADELKALEGTNLAAIGAETLLTEVGTLTDWGALKLDGGDNYWKAVASYFGIEGIDETLTGDDLEGAVTFALMQSANGDEEKVRQMCGGAMALYAAQNTSGVTASGLVSNWLSGDKTAQSFVDNGSASALGEAAAIYALWMSYKGDEFDNHGGDPMLVVGDALQSEEFATWVNSNSAAQDELDAFQASMRIINGAVEDEEIRESILTNGFDDPEVIKVMESIMGS